MNKKNINLSEYAEKRARGVVRDKYSMSRDFAIKDLENKSGMGNFLRNVGSLAFILAITGFTTITVINRANELTESRYSPDEFYKKAQWELIKNDDGNFNGDIDDNYRASGIPINPNNESLYRTAVRERNECADKPDEECLTDWIETPYFN